MSNKQSQSQTAARWFLLALVSSSAVSLGFFIYGAIHDHSLGFSYLVWNLFLAWLPLGFALHLTRVLSRKLWSSWEGLGMSLLWIVFLPNSFYMISDFIHLQDVSRANILYDALMYTSFIYSGVIVGFTSLYLMHVQLHRRFGSTWAWRLIAGTLIICSFGIYVGRDLRWNSWDILTNPGGLLFDVTDMLLHPVSYPQMIITTISFSVLLLSMYNLVWRSSQLLQKTR